MLEVKSTRFGDFEIEEEEILKFPLGIPGFEDKHKWVIVGDDDNAIMWMQSVDDGSLALPVTSPEAVYLGYNAQVPKEGLAPLGDDLAEDDLAILIVVTIPPGKHWEMTANLKAPICINRNSRTGMQAIALNEDYDFRHMVFEESVRKSMEAQAKQAVSTAEDK